MEEQSETFGEEFETIEVYEDEDGNEYLLVDGQRVPYNPDEFEEVQVIKEELESDQIQDDSEDLSQDKNLSDVGDPSDTEDASSVENLSDNEDSSSTEDLSDDESVSDVNNLSEADSDDEFYEVFEDEDGNEYLLIDGERVPYNPDEYEEVTFDDRDDAFFDSESYNPLAYESVQAATDVANDLARAGGSIAREGTALANDAATVASELKGAMDDITSLLDPKQWVK